MNTAPDLELIFSLRLIHVSEYGPRTHSRCICLILFLFQTVILEFERSEVTLIYYKTDKEC